ncbi:MAG: tRNA(Ile)-lysidine synthase [Planctomycetota bacterium]|jgi:tRNA(Ile)-lysidine synthase
MQSCLQIIPDHINRVYLAYSGGLDSSVLLHLLVNHRDNFDLIPWHINHGLQDSADAMEDFCRGQTNRYQLPLRVDHLNMGQNLSNVESQARQLRYGLFATALVENDCMVTAHHGDDQVETFLINAFRGSGPAGLRGVARKRPLGAGLLLRPLLSISREALESYADEHKLQWMDDPSNQSLRYDRNYLRQQVIPPLKSRWPNVHRNLEMVAEIQRETQQLLGELGEQDCLRLEHSAAGVKTLSITEMLTLSTARQKNLIRYWIKQRGLNALPASQLEELINQFTAKEDASPLLSTGDYSLRIYNKQLYLITAAKVIPENVEFEFDQRRQIIIDAIDLNLSRSEVFKRMSMTDCGQAITLKLSDTDKANRHRLKRLYQTHRVPPWLRKLTPILYLNGELAGLLF